MYADTIAVDMNKTEELQSVQSMNLSKPAVEIYEELKQALRKTDFFKPDPAAYWFRGSWVSVSGVLAYGFLLTQPTLGLQLIVCAFLGFLCVQSAAVAHENAHGSVTRNRKVGNVIGLYFMNLFFGSSYAFWKDKHGQHHKQPNSSSDPDIRPGLLNFTLEDAAKATGLAKQMTRYQHIIIWPLSSLMGFMFKIGSLRHHKNKQFKEKMDFATLVLHYLLWIVPAVMVIGVGDALTNYLLITWFAGMHLSFIFITNHLGNPHHEECDEKLGFLRQAVTARNINASPVLTSICNGLNSHIEHHLFPYVPFTRLAIGRKVTRAVFEKYGIRYHQIHWWQGFVECYRHNKKMAMAARGEG